MLGLGLSITKALSTLRSVITTNLKMWLGFETSETLGRELQTNDFSVNTAGWASQSATLSVSNNELINTSSGANNYGIASFSAPLENSKSYVVEGNYRNIDATNAYVAFFDGTAQTTIAATNASTSNVYFKVTITTASSGSPALKFNSTSTIGQSLSVAFSDISVKELTQITPDKSGNNNVGELFTGKALEFNGAGNYVDVDGFQMTGTNATFAFWFNSNDTLGRFFDTINGSNNRLILSFNNNQISILDHSVSWFNFGSVTTSVWNRCVITIKGTTAKCFVNGVQLGVDKTISTIDLSSNTDAAIGSHVFGTQSYFNGSLSDFQVYDKVWLQADVTYDYANPQNLVTDRDDTLIALSNLKGYWHLSEGAGSLAYDSSGESNNGTINGATYEPAQPRIPQLGMMNWSKGSNLFSYSQNFSLWNKEATVTLTSNYGTSPSGANDSTRIQMNANDSLYLDNLGSSKTFSIYVKGTQSETIRLSNGVGSLFTLTGNWDRIQLYDTSGASTLYSFNTYSGATARDMEIWGAQLEDSSSASAYRLTDGATTSNSTVIPNPTTPTQDIFGNAVRDRLNSLNLDGSGYAEVADDTDLDFGTGDFTLECWAKYDFLDQGSSWNVIVSNGSISSSGSGFSLASSASKFAIRLNAGTKVDKNFGTDNMTVGNWYHLVVTREGTTLKLYRDTSLKSSSTIISVDVDTSLPVRIGRDTLTTRFYQNLISDVRLYKGKALTSTEVENNYNAGLSAHTND